MRYTVPNELQYDKACDQAAGEAATICSRWGTRPDMYPRLLFPILNDTDCE